MESMRSCLVCRKKSEKHELCRFVRALDGEICFDEKGELPNRGAWICAKRPCLMKGLEKRLLFKGERTLPIDAEGMVKFIAGRIKLNTLARLGLMKRLGHIEMGKDATKRMIGKVETQAVIFAKDFSSRSVRDFMGNVEQENKPLFIASPFLMDEFGQCLGRKKTGVVALVRSRITDEILLQLNKLKGLDNEPQEFRGC